MKKYIFIFLLAGVGLLFSCSGEKYKTEVKTDSNGFTYETVTNDPMKTRVYTLENGLKVFLSVNKDEPRISTLIGVNAGSTSDPAETTGLAHYFEHMMFKGTDEIGTINWELEKPLLDEISDLFEQHRDAKDPATKKKSITKSTACPPLLPIMLPPMNMTKWFRALAPKEQMQEQATTILFT